MSTLSFYPTKNLPGMGDGGMVFCREQEDADRIRQLRGHKALWINKNLYCGWNSRLDEIQAMVIRTRLARFNEEQADRNRVAGVLRQPDPAGQPPRHREAAARHLRHLPPVLGAHAATATACARCSTPRESTPASTTIRRFTNTCSPSTVAWVARCRRRSGRARDLDSADPCRAADGPGAADRLDRRRVPADRRLTPGDTVVTAKVISFGALNASLAKDQTKIVMDRLQAASPRFAYQMQVVPSPLTDEERENEPFLAASAEEVAFLEDQLLAGEFRLVVVQRAGPGAAPARGRHLRRGARRATRPSTPCSRGAAPSSTTSRTARRSAC